MTSAEFIDVLKALDKKDGKLEVINLLTEHGNLNLPDAVMVYNTFIRYQTKEEVKNDHQVN